MSGKDTSDQQQVKLLNEIYRMDNQTEVKAKTIVLYDVYTDQETDQLALFNLHTYAQVLLDSKLAVDVDKQEND